MKSQKLNNETREIQSVARALKIIEILSNSNSHNNFEGMTLGSIAKETKLNISTCHHIIKTLVYKGYASQHASGGAYFLGRKVQELTSSRAIQFSLAETAMPELRKLNSLTGENVHLAVMQGNELSILTNLKSTHIIQVDLGSVNFSNSAHATAIGKSILAWLPDSEVQKIVKEKGLTKFTKKTITDFGSLTKHLRLVRRFGYSVDHGEFLEGVTSIGTVLRDQSGKVLGSVTCTLPNSRATKKTTELISNSLIISASELSAKISGVADR